MTAHQLHEYSSASDHDDEDIDNEDINGEDDAIPSSEDEDFDLYNPRYTNVHRRELEERTDETHTPQIGNETNINVNETETLQTGKERHSNGHSILLIDVFSNDDMESYCEHVLLHMYDLWTNWKSNLKRYNITKPKRTLRQALDHVHSRLQKEEWHWLITEIYSKDAQKVSKKQVPEILLIELTIRKRGFIEQEVAQKVFKSKSRDSVVSYGGRVKAKDIRGPSRTRVKLEVELNATRKTNEVLIDRVTTVKIENENLRKHVESIEAEMGKFKDWVSKQLNITIPPCTNIKNIHEDAGSLFQVLMLFHYLATRYN
ncbi:hypothetical protein Cgig2_023543 [Carnegiea gigantea]|uniref:Uncharacterized protein n=1 Tax=Carnegiea gigantea TaxID=171969 RepID=A0A9Q1JTP7_9CARY|nr:hypothetical protein Cgig2_023543 [Carnegiea gigantea]